MRCAAAHPPHFWHGVSNNQKAVYLECLTEELTDTAGHAPLELCRQFDESPEHLAALNAVAERAGGQTGPAWAFTAALPTIWATAAPAPRYR